MDSFEAVSYGPEVATLLRSGSGRVLATLSNALYLESCEGYVAAVVGEDTVDGPLSLRVSDLPFLLNTLRQQPNPAFHATGDRIDLGDQAQISLQHARAWTAVLTDRLGESAARFEAAQTLASAIAGHTGNSTCGLRAGPEVADLVRLCHSERSEESRPWRPFLGLAHKPTESLTTGFFASLGMTEESWGSVDGLGALNNTLARRMADGIVRFVMGLGAGDAGTAAAALVSLIGLGPGLTPSGDDLVSGTVAALVWQARLGAVDGTVAQEIAATINKAAERTNRISARSLHHACEGVLYAPAMELGTALLAGDGSGVRGPAQRLFSIGHTSGLDLATGLLVGCLATLPI